MKCGMKITLFLVLICVLMLPLSSLIISLPAVLKNNSQNLCILVDPTLNIDGNAQLEAAASSGDGSSGTPYIIRDKVIDASGLEKDGIRIQNTTAHFILKNCTVNNVDHAYAGIRIINVTNACLENNHVTTNNGTGFVIYLSHYSNLTGNTASKNTIIGYSTGFDFDFSQNNTVISNTANGHDYFGFIFYWCHNNTLTSNTANNNGGGGIGFAYSHNNTLTGNTANYGDNGFLFNYSHGNTLTGNTANENAAYGIILTASNYNTIRWNLLLDNTVNCIGNGGYGNVIESNDCGTVGVPGFNWILALLGCFCLVSLTMALNRKKEPRGSF